jgi:2-oxo-4-hydroxy-4-carboxy--5-ureidoimidazoline (OHCU) decarboxylase
MTADSVTEQAGAGLFSLTPEQAVRIERMNAEHQQKFGFPFIIAALKNTREQILSEFERRLCLDAGAAFEAALQQVELITGLRIERMIPVQEERP